MPYNVDIKPAAEVDGISYLPAMLGEKQATHEYLYWEFNERRGPVQALLHDDWKLVRFVGKREELYHLHDHPGEQHNVYDLHPKRVEKLIKLMDGARTEHPEFPLVKKK